MTPTELIALGGLVLSAILGILGYLTGREAREDARTMAREQRAAASEDARAARIFDARRTVYVDVMDYVYRIETFVSRTEPILTWEGAPGPPEFPPEGDARRQSAEIAAFGSKAMLDWLDAFKTAADEFQSAVFELRSARQAYDEHSDKEIAAWRKVEEKRQAVKALVPGFVEQVSEELRS